MKNIFENNVSSYACCSLLLATAACSNAKEQKAKSNEKPNVVLILTDDQGWGDFGFNGNENINTPMLDSLSEVSAHMTNFYVSPLSATSRAGLLTGRYHLRTGALCVTRAAENMDENEITIAEILRENDYATGCFGKWHNGAHYPQDPIGQGFDEYVGFTAGHLTNYFNSELLHNHTYVREEGYITDVLTDYAIEFIEKNKDKPFLCYIPYNAPHAPHQVPDKYYDNYKHLSKGADDTTPAVYAMIENIDDNIRRVFNRVKELGLDDNTIFVFTTDNGPQGTTRYNGELRGVKGQSWDGGFKTPCLVYWKGKVMPMKIDKTLSYVDVLPTILELCGIDYTQPEEHKFDGVSFSSLIGVGEDKAAEEKINSRYLFTHRSATDVHFEDYNSILFNNTYRLLRFPNGRYELYNIVEDPSQKNDLAGENSQVLTDMQAELDSLFAEVSKDYYAHCKRMTYVGAKETPSLLPSHEAYIKGDVKYVTNEHGWAGDWLSNINATDTLGWNVEAVVAGEYLVELQYALPEGAPKVNIGIKTDEANSPIVELPYFNSEDIIYPDRVVRVEAYDQTWNFCTIGNITLKEGNQLMMLDFSKMSGMLEGLEVKGIRINKVK